MKPSGDRTTAVGQKPNCGAPLKASTPICRLYRQAVTLGKQELALRKWGGGRQPIHQRRNQSKITKITSALIQKGDFAPRQRSCSKAWRIWSGARQLIFRRPNQSRIISALIPKADFAPRQRSCSNTWRGRIYLN